MGKASEEGQGPPGAIKPMMMMMMMIILFPFTVIFLDCSVAQTGINMARNNSI